MAKSKLNPATEALTRIDVDTHPLFIRLFETMGMRKLKSVEFEQFKEQPGLSLLFLVDDPNKFKESLDMAVIAPEIEKLFDKTLTQTAFSDPLQGRSIAGELGIYRLPSVVLFLEGRLLGSIDGLRNWVEYEQELITLLQTPPKKTIAIAPAQT